MSDCTHHWRLETPEPGQTHSPGVCLNCGLTAMHPNHPPEAIGPDKLRRAIVGQGAQQQMNDLYFELRYASQVAWSGSSRRHTRGGMLS